MIPIFYSKKKKEKTEMRRVERHTCMKLPVEVRPQLQLMKFSGTCLREGELVICIARVIKFLVSANEISWKWIYIMKLPSVWDLCS
jgi:hypothetical protein